MTPSELSYDIVVPTMGRRSLCVLLDALAATSGPAAERVLLVDDRPDRSAELPLGDVPAPLAARIEVLSGPSAGPAAARNIGWRAATAEWVEFLDDDVVPTPTWASDLADDLRSLPVSVAASQGRIVVPLPSDRPPIDWERNVAGLEDALWATADMAYRSSTLEQLGGFDERFPRAYREDADLGLRTIDAGYRIVGGRRTVLHPVRPAPWHVSIGKQAGNADDALMDRLHGRDWPERARAPRGRRRSHLTTAAAAAATVGSVVARRPRWAALSAAVWTASTCALAWRRIAPGPKTAREMASMLVTSAVLPLAATAAYLRGAVRARRLAPAVRAPAVDGPAAAAREPAVEAVLFDRDGTLVVDVPYNGDPANVTPVAQAREALDRLRAAGLPVAIVSNQSGVARGLLELDEVHAVNARVEELLGPFSAIMICPHGPDDGCLDRKPAAGMVERAAAALGVPAESCVVIGDIGSDVEAALAAGAKPILVPTAVTRPEEVEAAPVVARDLAAAVDLVLGGTRSATRGKHEGEARQTTFEPWAS